MTDPVPEPDQRALGIRPAQARGKLTLDRLEGSSAVRRRTISHQESGQGNPAVKTVHAIAHATGVTPGELINSLRDGHGLPGDTGRIGRRS